MSMSMCRDSEFHRFFYEMKTCTYAFIYLIFFLTPVPHHIFCRDRLATNSCFNARRSRAESNVKNCRYNDRFIAVCIYKS